VGLAGKARHVAQRLTIVLPELGESVAAGTVTAWRKKPGEDVAAGEALVDVTTDKVDVEVPSPAAGRLARIIAQEGATVAVGAPLAELDAATDGGEVGSTPITSPSAAATGPDDSGTTPAGATTAAFAGKEPAHEAAAPAASPQRHAPDVRTPPHVGPQAAQTSPHVVDASPLARRAAAKLGVDLSIVQPATSGQSVRSTDVRRAAAGVSIQAPASAVGQGTAGVPAQPLRGAAAALVDHMERSLQVPTATSFRTVEVAVLDERRRAINAALRAAGRSEKISFTHLIAFAIVRAVADVPVMAAAYERGPQGPLRVHRGMHLGLAVDIKRADGTRMLVVPVIHDADRLDFAAFVRAYEALVAKARGGSLQPSDLAGASMTLTNPGVIGTIASVPRLMPGQGTIVAAGAIDYPPGLRAAGEDTLRRMGVSKIMTLTSTYDHRIIQGAESGEFLQRVDHLVGGADGFYDEVTRSLGIHAPRTAASPPAPAAAPAAGTAAPPDLELARAAAAGTALITRYRTHGVNAARLDPLAEAAPVDPALDPASLGLDHALMSRVPASVLRVYVPGHTLADVIDTLRETYCSTIAYEVEHISNHEQRSWLRRAIESGAHRVPLSPERKRDLLVRLMRVEAFERYLRRTFLGQKTFSVEGLDTLVLLLQEVFSLLAADGTQELRLGMAHRGRLAVITHVVGRPYEEILFEFEQAQKREVRYAEGDVTGDVKYHQGARGTFVAGDATLRVVLANNPSHLEAVDAVVEGQTRAVQTDRSAVQSAPDRSKAAAVLVHGDAAFAGQGVVAEVFNLQDLAGYTVGGTIHIIANNQIGFTTLPPQERSTRYASDPAKGFDVPIIHVNADDVEAVVAAARLCVAYRREFHRDAVIDLIGYRRFGHNETDEPAYTQPQLYARIARHPPVAEIFARRLQADGIVDEAAVASLRQQAEAAIARAHAVARTMAVPAPASKDGVPGDGRPDATQAPVTRVDAATLRELTQHVLAVPANFTLHPKLARQLERRGHAALADDTVDWGLAEALAFASLLREGTPVRLTGQDTERGTFSHRHFVLHDVATGATWTPLRNIPGARASFEVYNSPLSEYAALGFEYGYSSCAPEALVLWEAQFGDFSNGAQIVIDQFIAAGQAKWQQTSRLTLLLPHGYEGAGPEHSSARLERFLQLAAEGNFRVANPTTPAQYFHLLRDQAKHAIPRPLVVMTPKSLLRLPAAMSRLSDLSNGTFASVIDDVRAVRYREDVRHVVLCSGKIYYDLTLDAARAGRTDLAIVRVELLEPFPFEDVLRVIASYPRTTRVTWVQEEPKNMGARAFVSRRIRERLTPAGILFDYVGRPDRASPSEGYPGAAAAEQERIVREVLDTRVGDRS
jgi:2-oxoglutarate decarboxylase